MAVASEGGRSGAPTVRPSGGLMGEADRRGKNETSGWECECVQLAAGRVPSAARSIIFSNGEPSVGTNKGPLSFQRG